MKVLIVGGVAGGAGTAARLRRNDENAEIILFEKGDYISFANCGLPYYIGGTITERAISRSRPRRASMPASMWTCGSARRSPPWTLPQRPSR